HLRGTSGTDPADGLADRVDAQRPQLTAGDLPLGLRDEILQAPLRERRRGLARANRSAPRRAAGAAGRGRGGACTDDRVLDRLYCPLYCRADLREYIGSTVR